MPEKGEAPLACVSVCFVISAVTNCACVQCRRAIFSFGSSVRGCIYIYVSAAVVGVYRVLISGVKRIAAAFSRLISVYVCVEIKNC